MSTESQDVDKLVQEGTLQVSGRSFAELVGVHPKTLSTWAKIGLPLIRQSGGRVRVLVGDGFRWLRERDRLEYLASRGRPSQVDARVAKLTAEARLKELDVAEREAKYVDAAEVSERWNQIMVSIREAVLGIPGIAVQSGLISPDQEMKLDEICREALSTLGSRRSADDDDETT